MCVSEGLFLLLFPLSPYSSNIGDLRHFRVCLTVRRRVCLLVLTVRNRQIARGSLQSFHLIILRKRAAEPQLATTHSFTTQRPYTSAYISTVRLHLPLLIWALIILPVRARQWSNVFRPWILLSGGAWQGLLKRLTVNSVGVHVLVLHEQHVHISRVLEEFLHMNPPVSTFNLGNNRC